jgi:tetratricopeptide (TPR) repeat protein
VPEQAVRKAAPPAAAAIAAPAPAPAAAARAGDAEYQRLLASGDRKYDTGNFLAAIGEYRKAAILKPTGPALVGLARALYDANRPVEALRELDRAIQVDARYAPAWLLLGEIHQGDGRTAEARTAYERFLRLQPTGDQARAVREILAKFH